MEGRKLYVKHPSYNSTFVDQSASIEHTGKSKLDGAPGPGSGRYPLGSGKNPYQDYRDRFAGFLDRASRSEDGTLTAIGKIRYRTTNKYKFVSDEELQNITNRRKREKEYEDINRQVSPGFRFQEKVGKSVEDAVSKAIGEAVKDLVSKELGIGVSKLMKMDKKTTKETTEKVANVIKNLNTVRKNTPPIPKTQPQEAKEPSKSEEQKPQEQKPAENNSNKKKDRKVTAGPGQENKKSGGEVKVTREPEKPKESSNENKSDGLKDSEINRIKALRRTGMSVEQVAQTMKISVSTVEKYTKK